jgi:hypothetical protein
MPVVGGAFFAKLPKPLQDDLIFECGGTCPIPRCKQEIWDVFTIDGNIANIIKDNLIGLCHTHFSMASAKTLTSRMLATIRALLSSERFPEKGPAVRKLVTREDYLRECARQLYTTEDELYIQYVGPLCLHPNWYFERRDQITKLPNMDRPVQEFIRANADKRTSKVRLTFRNAPRYVDKINEVVRPSERDKFIQEVLEIIDQIWGKEAEKGPDLCCLDTGFLHIPTIYKRVAITSSRTGASTPIQQGALYLDRDIVELEKQRFNDIFDANNRGLKQELDVLKTYVQGLWKTDDGKEISQNPPEASVKSETTGQDNISGNTET